MKCISKFAIPLVMAFCLLLTACGGKLDRAYDVNSSNPSYTIGAPNKDITARAFAEDLCVVSENISGGLDLSLSEASGLFDISKSTTIVAKNANKVMNPASLTKVMTALLALKYGKLDDTLIASPNVNITESGAQLLKLSEGDKMTLEEALYALLIYSANDVGVLIAEYISGSVEDFALLMTREAHDLGATNTNFKNPHGLTDEEHYTTVYDLYLIFNEAMKYEKFLEIIGCKEHELQYFSAGGQTKTKTITNTNSYLNGGTEVPENVIVIGGKTGTTDAAGSCLILLSNDINANPYISVVLNAGDREQLYEQMSRLLKKEAD
ncbi:MAG: D-alanyl-D-alanine carboxypeptidase [Lachnospiraceae bacterium]|nr:D-alanyl-D-alanine carboxypeptidase [Lachnospiraceae bacterium]